MSRMIQVTVPPAQTDPLLEEIRQVPELIGLRVQRGGSLHPPGDVISVDVTTRSLHAMMRLFGRYRIGEDAGTTLITQEQLSVIHRPLARRIVRDGSESTWEEMEILIGRESNMSTNALLIMAFSGFMAVLGLLTSAFDVVIAAMLIAPGFEPISRIALGMTAQSKAWRRGLADWLGGYASLVGGALAAALIFRLFDNPLVAGNTPSLQVGALISYWSTTSMVSVLVSFAACVSGAVLVATNRSMLTSGVMVALALIPSAAIFGLALVFGKTDLALNALLRWGIEVAMVFLCSALVFFWMQRRIQRRKMIL